MLKYNNIGNIENYIKKQENTIMNKLTEATTKTNLLDERETVFS